MAPAIISCAAARAAGLKRFFTGERCSRCGCVAERYVRRNECTECMRRRNAKFNDSAHGRARRVRQNRDLQARRRASRKSGEVHYIGQPCRKHGPSPKRYVINDGCVECLASPENAAKQKARGRIVGGGTWTSYRVANTRRRARLQGIAFDEAAFREILRAMPDRCPVFGTPFVVTHGTLGPASPTVDRIVPSLGYSRGNLVVISARANAIKQDATAAELRAVADWLDRTTAAGATIQSDPIGANHASSSS